MSKKVDERVVEMRFDNKDFERNVQTSLSTLDKLKKSLKLDKAATGLENVGSAAKKIDLSGVSSGVETLQAKFSSLQVIGVTALGTITNAAVNAGSRMISALTIDPVISGFQEYETQMGAIQTILANTESKGTTLNQVNAALAELNEYADQTIYNFTEMTRNIGTFTAAGVGLEQSVSAIKGIANLAAVSGSTSAQASQAMYQLSQALAAGRVSLMDWNSVVTAGMGGELFQNALKRTAENMGYNVDALIEKYGSFRESLTQGGWLTAEVLTETLTQLSGAYTEADLIAQGYTEQQARDIVKLAETAVSAATEVKSFTQLIDTVKEALGSGWAQTWQIIFGDFEEAKELFTGISEVINGMVTASADARNNLLREGLGSGWDQFLDLGIANEDLFKETVMSVAKSHGVAIEDMINDAGSFEKTLKDGWMTADILAESIKKAAERTEGLSVAQLNELGYTKEQAEALQELNEQVQNGTIDLEEYAEKMSMLSGRENIIEGLKNVWEALVKVVSPIKEAFDEVFPALTGEQLYELTERFKEFTESLDVSEETIENIKSVFKGLFSVIDLVGKGIGTLVGAIGMILTSDAVTSLAGFLLDVAASIGDFFTALNEGAESSGFFGAISSAFSVAIDGISMLVTKAVDGLSGFADVLSSIGDAVADFASMVMDGIGGAFEWISENVTGGDVFAGLAGGGIFILLTKLGGLVSKIKEFLDGLGDASGIASTIADNFSNILGSVHDSLEAFTAGINATTLLKIAAAIGILSFSLRSLSELSIGEIGTSLFAMGAMFAMLNFSFQSISSTLDMFSHKGLFKAGLAIISMSIALNIFASAMQKIATLDLGQILMGLFGLGIGLLELTVALKSLDKANVSLKSIAGMVALAYACELLSDALVTFGGMSWDEIQRGLVGMAGALAELVISMTVLSKIGGKSTLAGSASLLIAVQSLDEISENLSRIGKLSWEEIGRGLAGMGGALAELGIAAGVLGQIGGFSSLLGATTILVIVQALDPIATALERIGNMSWEGIAKGLVGMGGALLELGLVAGLLGAFSPLSILGAAAVLVIVQALDPIAEALEDIGALSWEEIARGLVGMGGALLELGLVAGLLGAFSPLSIIGAAAVLVIAPALDPIAEALEDIGALSWEEIARGLVGMGGALAELGIVAGLLGTFAPLSVLGSASILIAVQGLGDLADALKKFGEMNWDEIARGLSAMGGAMLETAIGGLLNTLSGIGADSIATMAEPLGMLADSVKKWTDVEVPEGFGTKLAEIAGGVSAFNFSGWGADAIAAMGGSLGTLADSVEKWAGVEVPSGLGEQLSALAPGIEAFNFAGWGAGAIAEVAEPLGTLADSVAKWANMTIPDGLGDSLVDLAKGVTSFTFGTVGALTIMLVAGPIGDLADSVSKWSGITVPAGLGTSLIGLADGVKAFNFGMAGALTIMLVTGPLGDLADSVKKWNDVTIPSGIGASLADLATGVQAWTLAFIGGWSIGAVVGPLGKLAEAVKKCNDVTIPYGIGEKLESLASGFSAISGLTSGNISTICADLGTLKDAVGGFSGIDLSSIATNLQGFADAINSISISSENFSQLGSGMVDSFIEGISTGTIRARIAIATFAIQVVTEFNNALSNAAGGGSAAGASLINGLAAGIRKGASGVSSAVESAINAAKNPIKNSVASFEAGGKALAAALARGLDSNASSVGKALVNAVASASKQISSYYSSFYSAGRYLCSGLARGISSGRSGVVSAAASMAASAASSARKSLGVHSPSKVFYGIGDFAGLGFVNALTDYQPISERAGSEMADSARRGLTDGIRKVASVLDSEMDTTPTIRPVLDLTDFRNGVGMLDSLMTGGQTLAIAGELGSISRSMNRRNQNGSFDDVVYAIDRLRGDLSEVGGNTYSINGITYDDGSNVAEAVASLVRATRIERRV